VKISWRSSDIDDLTPRHLKLPLQLQLLMAFRLTSPQPQIAKYLILATQKCESAHRVTRPYPCMSSSIDEDYKMSLWLGEWGGGGYVTDPFSRPGKQKTFSQEKKKNKLNKINWTEIQKGCEAKGS